MVGLGFRQLLLKKIKLLFIQNSSRQRQKPFAMAFQNSLEIVFSQVRYILWIWNYPASLILQVVGASINASSYYVWYFPIGPKFAIHWINHRAHIFSKEPDH